MVLTSQGKAGEALSLLQAAISALPDYAEAHNNFGVLQRDVGAIPDALASYERALALVPDSRNAGVADTSIPFHILHSCITIISICFCPQPTASH